MKSIFEVRQWILSTVKVRRVTKDAGWATLGQVSALAGSVAIVKILVNRLGSASYGEVVIGLSIMSAISLLVQGPLINSVLRYASNYHQSGETHLAPAVFWNLHRILIVFTVIASSLAVMSGYFLNNKWGLTLALAIIMAESSGLYNGLAAMVNARQEHDKLSILRAVDPWARLALALLCLLVLSGKGSTRVLIGFSVGYLLLAVTMVSMERNRATVKAKPFECSRVMLSRSQWIAYAAPFVIWGLFASVGSFGDRWVTQSLLGSASVGIYAAILQLASAPAVLWGGVLSQVANPLVFERIGSNPTRKGLRDGRKIIIGAVAAFCAIAIVGELILLLSSRVLVRLFTTAEIAVHHEMILLMFPAICLFYVGQQIQVLGCACHQTSKYLPAYLLNAAATVGLSVTFGRAAGLQGVVWALVGSNLLYLVAVLEITRRVVSKALITASPLIPATSSQL